MKDVRKILFITLTNLGDIVLTTPVFSALAGLFPGAVIDVITGPPGEGIFKAASASGRVTVRTRRQSLGERIKEVVGIRREKYDLVVDLKASLMPLVAGARMSFPLFPARSFDGHMVDKHLGVIRKLLRPAPAKPVFYVPVSERDKEFVAGIMGEEKSRTLADGPFITINPGAKSHLKRWPAEKYAELIKGLERIPGCRIFVAGGMEDKAIVKKILDLSRARAVDLSGETSLGALYELIRRSDLFVTNDSGPLHIASAAGTPTLAIFGPSDERKYGPLAPFSVVVSPNAVCRPCGKAQCSKGMNDGCISRVTAGEVLEAATGILKKTGKRCCLK